MMICSGHAACEPCKAVPVTNDWLCDAVTSLKQAYQQMEHSSRELPVPDSLAVASLIGSCHGLKKNTAPLATADKATRGCLR